MPDASGGGAQPYVVRVGRVDRDSRSPTGGAAGEETADWRGADGEPVGALDIGQRWHGSDHCKDEAHRRRDASHLAAGAWTLRPPRRGHVRPPEGGRLGGTQPVQDEILSASTILLLR